MKPDKKSPEPDSAGASKTSCRAIDNSNLPDQVKLVNLSETPFKTIFDVLIDNAKKINHGIVLIELNIRDGRPCRFTISRKESFLLKDG